MRISDIEWYVEPQPHSITIDVPSSYPKLPLNAVYGFMGNIIRVPSVMRVIFNDPATIIYWKDGTKTVVKCQEGDTYSKETGFVMCYLKKLLGNDNTFNKEITKWVTE